MSSLSCVADDCHANFVLVSHLTVNNERCHASFTTRVDAKRTTCSIRIPQLNVSTTFYKEMFNYYNKSQVTLLFLCPFENKIPSYVCFLVLMARSIPSLLPRSPSLPRNLAFDFKIMGNAPLCEASLWVQMPHGWASERVQMANLRNKKAIIAHK